MTMAQIIYTDGLTKAVTPKNGTDFQLDELKAIVGGYIEIVETIDGRLLVLDEEGKLKDKPINMKATRLYKQGMFDFIVGDVLVCETDEIK